MALLFAGTRGLAQVDQDISGAYEFEHENEFIQLNVQNGKLEGYISRLGDESSDKGTPLTFFFTKTKLQGNHVAFTTRQVHGLWYSFDGQVVPGSASSRDEPGYMLLQGTMTLHHVDLNKQDRAEQHRASYRLKRGNS